jgi:hypothetical protein
MLVREFALVAPASTYLDGASLYAGHDGLRFLVRLQDTADTALGGIHENPRV